jgi:hypothetical protein
MNKFMKLSTALLSHGAVVSESDERLLSGQVVSMYRSKGRILSCSAGKLWVTLEHEPGDIILEANQSLDIDENGCVVISAIGPSIYKVA